MTQATPRTLPASIGPTSTVGTTKKSEPQEDFSGTFRVQLKGKVQETSPDSASTLTVLSGQEQIAGAGQAASAALAGARGAAAVPKPMQSLVTSHDVTAIEALADHAPQGAVTEATDVLELVTATPRLEPSSVAVAAAATPTQVAPMERVTTGESSGTTTPMGVSGVAANQAAAVAPTVGQAGAVPSDIAADKGSSRQNIAPPGESSTPALTRASPVARVATGQSSGTASAIGVSGVGTNQVSAVAPGTVPSDVAPDKGLSRQNFAPPGESSTPALTQASPVARVATGQSSGSASPIGVNGIGANQASAVAPGTVPSDVAPHEGVSPHNLARPTDSSIPLPAQAAPPARAAAGQSKGVASPIQVSSDGESQVGVIAPAAGQVGVGAVPSGAAPDKELSQHNFARSTESSIQVSTQVEPPTRAAIGQWSGAASPIHVSGDGENQTSAIAPPAGQLGTGVVQPDVAPEKELSLHNLTRFTETSIPAPGQAAVAVVPAVAVTASEVHGTIQSQPLPIAVDTALSNPGWASAMAARVVWGVTQGMQSASIEINPRDLGPVSVNLNVVGEETSITFVSQHALVREALEAALPRLRELFSGEGLNLGEVDISSGEGRSNGNDDAMSADDMQSNGQADAHADPAVASSSDEARTHRLDSLVDTFA